MCRARPATRSLLTTTWTGRLVVAGTLDRGACAGNVCVMHHPQYVQPVLCKPPCPVQVWVGLVPDGLEQETGDQHWVPPTPQGLQRRLTDGTEPAGPLPSLVAGQL